MESVGFAMSKYVPDNSAVPLVSVHTGRAYKGGYGGLLWDGRVYRVATNAVARQIRAAITLAAAAAESRAVAADIEPGHVSKAFSGAQIRRVPNFYKLKSGQVNPRWAATVSVTGRTQPGDRDEEGYAYNLRSDPVVLEAGSGYNEGSRTDRPALRVMASAAKAVSKKRGVRVVTP